LAEFQRNNAQHKLMKAKYDFMEKGHSEIKSFYERFNENRKQFYITDLENKQGNLTSKK